jgi:hypothetical protein
MADPLAIGAAILGVISTAIGIASRLWPSSPAVPRETVVPPAPPSAPLTSLQDARIDALSARQARTEQLLDNLAAETREGLGEIAREVTVISTTVKERTARGGRSHGGSDRESS